MVEILPFFTASTVTNQESHHDPGCFSFAQHTLFSTLYIFAEDMADDTRDSNRDGKAPAPAVFVAPPKKLPRGMVLGKDGKP